MKNLFCCCAFLFLVVTIQAQQLWSNANSWPGNLKPQAGQNITIPIGTTIVLDENTPALGGLTILGTLQFAHQNLSLSASWIMVHGTLQIGSPANLFNHKAIITLTGSDPNESVMGMGTRGIMVMGGALELHATSPSVLYTKLNQHANAGATVIQTAQNTNWNIGDEIALTPTDYYNAAFGNAVSQRVSITSLATNSININQGLNSFRWGLLQYATPNGMSIDSNNRVTPPKLNTDSTSTPTILDERAVVGNLTRNIVIQAPNDALWNNQGFGVHVMVMGTGAQAHLNGVEIKRGGQRNRLGRYPFHWHMLSYSGSATLADATGQYIRNSVINSSTNRGIVIHGTNGVLVKSNIVYDILGHGIFTEDAVERRNIIDSNLVMRVRNTTPTALPILKVHEGNTDDDFGSSGFWISNPDNVLTNNIAADCGAFGFWLAFTTQPWGESSNVLHTDGLLLNPSRLRFGVFDNNTASSCRNRGIMLDLVENSNAGTVVGFQYQSTTNGRNPEWPYSTLRRFTLSRYKVWKNGKSGIWDRAAWPDNFEVVSADNCGRFFAGSGADGIIERSLVIGTSLNHLMNNTNRPLLIDAVGGDQTPAAFATYHSAFDIRDNIVINFPAVSNTRSGAFATEDYYIRPVDKGQVRNVNNLLIQTHPGVKLPAIQNHFALSGALWDPLGNWNNSIVDSSKYLVYNQPFFTYNQSVLPAQEGSIAGGVLVNGPFFGINDFEINRANDPQQDLMAVKVNRLNANFDSVATWQINQAGDFTWLLAHMRHFAAQTGGYFDLSFPTIDNVNDVAFTVENMLKPTDSLIMAVEYSGSFAIGQVYISSFPNFMSNGHANWPTSYTNSPSAGSKYVFQPVQNRTALVNANGVGAYWHDRVNNKVWLKIRGGIPMFWNENDYGQFSDEKLYRKFNFRIYGEPLTTWLGTINSNWDNPLNWSNGVPTATTNAAIPLVANQPTINSNQFVQNITIDSGVVIVNSATLTISGTINNFGLINGNVITNDIDYTQVINGNGSIQNLSIQNANGITIYPSIDAKLNLTGALTLNNNTLNTNNNLVLKSTALTTASVAPINLGSINGEVIVERYLMNKRAWRFLTAPLYHSNSISLNASWQQSMHMVGPSGTGLDAIKPGYSIMNYNINTQTWQGVNNTISESLNRTNAFTGSKAFAAFVVGNRSLDINSTTASSDVTLASKGRLLTGNQTINLGNINANDYALIGNPYPSTVDLNQVYLNAGTNNIKRTFYTWDPNLSSTGGYVTISWDGLSAYDIIPNSNQTQHIQSGQAFFVQATNSGTATVAFDENDKSSNSIPQVFSLNNGKIDKLLINLQCLQQGNISKRDGVMVSFGANYSQQILPTEDAEKLYNNEEGISIVNQNKNLSIERRPFTGYINDTIHLNFNKLLPNTNYQLEFLPFNFDASIQQIKLIDNYLHTQTNLSKSNTNIVAFTINTQAQSFANGRFKLVFNANAPLINQALTLNSVLCNSQSVHVLTINQAAQFKQYELQESDNGIEYKTINIENSINLPTVTFNVSKTLANTTYFRVKATTLNDKIVFSNVTLLKPNSLIEKIKIAENPVRFKQLKIHVNGFQKGNYNLSIYNSVGVIVLSKMLNLTDTEQIFALPIKNLGNGNYILVFQNDLTKKSMPFVLH